MIRRYRRLLALALLPVVINALVLVAGPTAFADEAHDAQAEAAFSDAGKNDPASRPDADHFGKNCNHGCHAAGHLLGQVCATVIHPVAAPAAGVLSAPPFIPPVSLPELPFRPPRISFSFA